MKEIKRYYAHIKNGNGTELCYSINYCGDIVNYTDHKAVVETLDDKLLKTSFVIVDLNKKIDDLLLVADHRWDELKKAEKRIEELEAERLTIIKALDEADNDCLLECECPVEWLEGDEYIGGVSIINHEEDCYRYKIEALNNKV